ncbi:MAG: acyl-CoA desaturase, partial [Betaproteobacteria bacterium]|nr:acyl-CoA desaturase [Betaproteobacteria bacterium]
MAMKRTLDTLRCWFDSASVPAGSDLLRVLPLIAVHAGCLGALWVGASLELVGLAAALFAVRMFAVTAFYHRYFSHRAFRCSRPMQFLFAVLGASAVQRGPL